MNEQQAYVMYCALTAHFTGDYDYFRYNGKMSRAGAVSKRNDRHHFYRLKLGYNQKDLRDYYVANIVAGESWVGNFTKENYINWKRINVRLPEIVKEDLHSILDVCKEKDCTIQTIFKVPTDGTHPVILQLLSGKFIRLETFTILAHLIGFIDAYDRKMSFDPIWQQTSKLIKNYEPFLKYDRNEMKKTILNNLT